jgi:hypothetical protein
MSFLHSRSWVVLLGMALGNSAISQNSAVAGPTDGPKSVFDSDGKTAGQSSPPEVPPASHDKVPDAAAQEKALKLIRGQIFSKEYADRTAVGRKRLAQLLIRNAAETKDDPVARYVLLKEAIAISSESGDITDAFEAIDALAKGYAVDALALKLASAQRAISAASNPSVGQALAEACVELSQTACDANNFDLAARALSIGEAAARRSGDPGTLADLKTRVDETRRMQIEFTKVEKASKVLAKTPGDPEANLVYGRYLCFIRGKWDQGLPMLASSGDRALTGIAARELTKPTDAEKQCELADSWWELAEKLHGADQPRMRLRAAYWYEQALPRLSGLKKTLAEKRVADAESDALLPNQLVAGLQLVEYPRLDDEDDGGPKPIDLSRLTQPIGPARVVKSLLKWERRTDVNTVMRGYLWVDRPGSYAIRSASWWGCHYLYINGIQVNKYSNDNYTQQVELRKGANELLIVAIVSKNAKFEIFWRVPGGQKEEPVPDSALCHLTRLAKPGPLLKPIVEKPNDSKPSSGGR